MKNNTFGSRIREIRNQLNAENPGEYSIRKVAARIGVQSGYLSRIERGLADSLSEEKIRALAIDLKEDPDFLLALAGKVSSDIRKIIRQRPRLFAKLIRDMKDLPDTAVEAESEYRKIERRLNQAQSIARIGSWERNFKTGETYWSDSLYDIFEFDPKNGPPGYTEFLSRIHPDDRDMVRSASKPGEPGMHEVEYGFRIICLDERLRHAHVRVAVEHDENGEPVRIIGTTRDVTEQVETRRALNTSEALLKSVLESPERVIIFSLDREYRYLVFNESHARTMRSIWGVDILLGMNMLEAIKDPADRAKAKHNFDRALNGEHFTVIEEYGDPNLMRKYWEDNYSPIYNENGAVIGLTVILTDVSRRVRTQRKLAESERLYRTLAENIPGCDIYLFDSDVRCVAAAGTEMRRFGWNAAHWIGKKLHESLPKATADILEPHYSLALQGRHSYLELPYENQYYAVQTIPVAGEGDEVKYGMVLVQNITNRKRAEDVLKRSQAELERKVSERTSELNAAKKELENQLLERWNAEHELAKKEALYRSLVETIPYGVEEIDVNGTRVYANAAMNRILGYEPGELEGTSIWDDRPDREQANELREYIANALENEPEPSTLLCRTVKKDGAILDLRVDWDYQRGSKGEITGIIAVVTDITEEKKAERELLEQRELFNKFADQIPGAAFIKDNDSRLIFVNKFMDEVYGAYRWLGMRADEFMPPEIAMELLSADRKTLAEGPQVFETAIPDKSGKIRAWLEYKFPIHREGKHPLIGCVSLDVSERKIAEQELVEQRELFNTFAEQIPGLAFIKDADSRLLFANKAMCEIYGADKHLGKRDDEYLPPEVAKRTLANDAAALEAGALVAEGEVLDVLGLSRVWRTVKFRIERQGRPPLLGGVAIEITGEKRLLEALQESEAHYRSLAEQSPISIMAFDENGYVTFVNSWHLEVFARGKLDADFFLGNRITELPGLVSAGVDKEIGKLLEGDHFFMEEVHIPRFAAGHEGWQSIRGVPIIRDGKPSGGILIREDITEQHLARKALADSEERYRLMAENVSDVLWRLDKDLNPLYYSPSIKNLIGYTPEEAMATPREKRHTPEGLEIFASHAAEIKSLIEAGEYNKIARRLELSHLHKDGRTIWTEVELRAVTNEYGDFSHIIGVSRDITERRKAEIQVRESLAEKEVLLQEIHHRVKNNLQVITSLLDMTARRSDSREVASVLNEMQAKVQAMSLIHAMIYRGESLNRIDFSKYLKSLYAELSAMYSEKAKQIEPVFHLEEVEIPLNQAVPCALVLNEILSNVFRHAFPDEMSGQVEISLEKQGEQVLIRIKDEGIGLPDTVDPEKTRTMGLKLIREIIRMQLQGSIEILSEHGTEVQLQFKITRP